MLLLLIADTAILAVSFGVSYWLRFSSGWILVKSIPLHHWYLWALAASLLVHILVFKYSGLYRQRHGISGVDEFAKIFRGVFISFILLMALTFFVREFTYSRLMLTYTWAFNIVFLILSRTLLRRLQVILRRRGFGITRCLIVGTGKTAWAAYERLRSNPRLGYRIAGFVRAGGEDQKFFDAKSVKVWAVPDGAGKNRPFVGALIRHKTVLGRATGVTAKQVRIPGGYRMDFWIPVKLIQAGPLKPWQVLRFNVLADDNDRVQEVCWSAHQGDWTTQRPHTWGRMVLVP